MIPATAVDEAGHGAASARRRANLTLLLMAAMVGPVLIGSALGLLAPFLLPSLQLSRGQLGLLISVITATGGLASPLAGRVTDRVGSRRATFIVFAATMAAFASLALAGSYLILMLGCVVGGIALAAVNPATNKLIFQHYPPAQRGSATGMRQAGAHVGNIVGGALLPVGATVLGWRATFALLAVGAAAGGVATLRLVPSLHPTTSAQAGPVTVVPASTRRLAVYALLLGLANSSLYLLVLYAIEEVGVGPRLGGLALSLVGLAAVIGRYVWTRWVEARQVFVPALRWIALAAAGSYVAMLFAAHGAGWLALVIGSITLGLSASSWQPIAALAATYASGEDQAGTAVGDMLLGFFCGLSLGPPIHGVLVDWLANYDAVWLLSILAAVSGWLVLGRSALSTNSSPGQAE